MLLLLLPLEIREREIEKNLFIHLHATKFAERAETDYSILAKEMLD